MGIAQAFECGVCVFTRILALTDAGFSPELAEREAEAACGFVCEGVPPPIRNVIVKRLQSRRNAKMACATTHKVTSNVQGPGPCCAALSASGLAPAVGVRVVGTNKAGKCIVCEITTSRSPKHPGMLVFKRGKASVPGSNVSCPSTAEGCCALIGQ